MAVQNYKLKKGQFKDQVINPGIDKNIPVGFVDVVYNADGSMAGFMRGGTFYQPGEKVPEVESQGSMQTRLGKANVDLMNAKEAVKNAKIGSPEYDAAVANVEKASKAYDQVKSHIAAREKSDKAASQKKQAIESSTKTAKDAASDLDTAKKELAIAKATGDDAAATAAQQKIDIANQNIKLASFQSAVAKGQILGKPIDITSSQPAVGPVVTPVAKADTKIVSDQKSSSSKAAGNKGGVIVPTADEAHAKAVAALQTMGKTDTYAVTMGLIDSDPSLKDIFYRDVYLPISQGKDPVAINKFQADIQNSKWFTSYIEPAREAEAIKYGDPATWNASLESAKQIVAKAASTAGYTLSIDQINQIADQTLHKAGGKAQAITGLVSTEMNAQIMSTGKINPVGGAAATNVASLKTFAGNYMVSNLYTDADYTSWADQIAKGTTTQSAIENMIKQKAKDAYGSLAQQIDAGLQPKDIVSPNVTRIASILEMNPNDINPTDPRWAKMIWNQDPTDPSKQTLKPYWQSEQDAMKDPSWAYTKNARSSLDNIAHNVLTNLGLTY